MFPERSTHLCQRKGHCPIILGGQIEQLLVKCFVIRPIYLQCFPKGKGTEQQDEKADWKLFLKLVTI